MTSRGCRCDLPTNSSRLKESHVLGDAIPAINTPRSTREPLPRSLCAASGRAPSEDDHGEDVHLFG